MFAVTTVKSGEASPREVCCGRPPLCYLPVALGWEYERGEPESVCVIGSILSTEVPIELCARSRATTKIVVRIV